MVIDTACFGSNFIGIKGCSSDTAPKSGLWLHDLRGVNLRLASNLAEGEHKKGITLLRDMEQEAIKRTANDLITELPEHYNFGAITQQSYAGGQSQTVYLSPITGNVGILFTKTKANEEDRYLSTIIETISVRSKLTQAAVPIQIIDGNTTVNLTADITAYDTTPIQIEHKMVSHEVKVLIEADNLELASSFNDNSYYWDGGTACGHCRSSLSSCGCSEDCVEAIGIDENGAEVSQFYGILASVRCECDPSQFFCSIINRLGFAVRLKLGILIAEDWVSTKRVNPYVSMTDAQAKDWIVRWAGGYDDHKDKMVKGEYPKALEGLVESLRPFLAQNKSKCITCNSFKTIPAIP